jgi:predicted amidohydrolase YtcJ
MLTWSFALLLAAPTASPADVVFLGAHVVTLESTSAPAAPTALAARDGRIVAVGTDSEMAPFLGPKTRRVDLKGATVLPGLTDAHVHVESLGQALEQLDLVGALTLDEALQRVARAARALPPGEWLIGRGWDQNDWPEKRFPSAADLDRVAADRPVYLTRVDGHAAWVNSRALQVAGIDARTPDPSGGRFLRDAAGAPTGLLIDAAANEFLAHKVPPATDAARKRRLRRGLRACAEVGLTEVHDAGIDRHSIELYKQLLADGGLDVRVYAMLRGADFLAADATLAPEIGLGDGQFTLRAVKVVADGALGSRGALLLEPYSDEPGSRGLLTVDWDAYRRILREALARGFQVNTHAIGDAANRRVLDAYAEAFGTQGGAARRFRVEHAQVLAPADVPRFKALGVIPSMQPTHCTSDMPWAETRLGVERARGAYLWKTFLDQGVPVAGGSDAPVESIDPRLGLYAAVTRQDRDGHPPGGWHPDERVSARQALDMFTRHAAYAAFEEQDRGTLAIGKRADLTVFSSDVTRVSPADILKAKVVMTVVGGRVAFSAKEQP